MAARKSISHNHVDLPPLVSVEATGACVQMDNSEYYLQLVIHFQVLPRLMRTSLSL
jgi:hypothetical protein